jgi:carboxyl-terminal processing protease
MLEQLDPHSHFFTREEYLRLMEAATGVYAGVGVELEKLQSVIYIQKVRAGGPAARAGLEPGDQLVRIDGRLLQGVSVDRAEAMLRGKRSTKVKVEVFRRGWKGRREIVLERKTMRQKVVSTALLCGKVGYMRIAAFHPGTSTNVKKAVLRLKKKLSGRLDKLIIDLRSNPGGLMSEGLRVADLFVQKGLLMIKKGKKGKLREKYWASKGQTFTGIRLAVVVDGRTASAAEIVAAAIQEHGLGDVVGRRTYGKGSFQELVRFSEGSVLKLTVGRYYTPKGVNLDARGIEPDYHVPTGRPAQAARVSCRVSARIANDAPLLTALAVLTGSLSRGDRTARGSM